MEPTSHRTILEDQIREAYGRVTYSQTTQVKQAELLKEKDTCLKWATIIASILTTGGILGFIILNTQYCAIFSVITSMVTLVISSILKSVDYNGQSKEHKNAADRLWPIREEYVSLLIDFDTLTDEEIIERRDVLQNRTGEIYADAPTTSEKSYKKAQKALKYDEEQYFSKEELNKLLPERLRK